MARAPWRGRGRGRRARQIAAEQILRGSCLTRCQCRFPSLPFLQCRTGDVRKGQYPWEAVASSRSCFMTKYYPGERLQLTMMNDSGDGIEGTDQILGMARPRYTHTVHLLLAHWPTAA